MKVYQKTFFIDFELAVENFNKRFQIFYEFFDYLIKFGCDLGLIFCKKFEPSAILMSCISTCQKRSLVISLQDRLRKASCTSNGAG